MAAFEKFNFKTLEDFNAKIAELGVGSETTEDFSPLAQPLAIGTVTAPNRIAVLPMEGCDSEEDGPPSELVFRRYRRFASGGAGLLWFEACAVVQEGRANRLQMFLREILIQNADYISTCAQSSGRTAGEWSLASIRD